MAVTDYLRSILSPYDLVAAGKVPGAKIVKKFGFTLKEYEELDGKVLRDPKLREKLGEIKLKKDKGEK